jgi:hypothetical protein
VERCIPVWNMQVVHTYCMYAVCMYVATNRSFHHIEHSVNNFYNWDHKCILRGTKWPLNKMDYLLSLKGFDFQSLKKKFLSLLTQHNIGSQILLLINNWTVDIALLRGISHFFIYISLHVHQVKKYFHSLYEEHFISWASPRVWVWNLACHVKGRT